ncbi:MAG: filamentous hemagglutinin N-terminal domain-containing protein [Lyngbya sp. HA4199-MV5]|nr:filamentous hemagglutinin N-terminal domain-containing protein [Lyngbya sp. HA4199-MV5]
MAQVTPDRTLGTESSVVNRDVIIKGLPSDRIEGGARRGANLFHSFLDFNVAAQRGVYFANPTGVNNILSRVTGSNASNIAGRLGVLGGANLFLLNPNGIIFGPNASLDVAGSFMASTARDLLMADGTVYSATNPTAASLLTVSVPLGVQFGKDQPRATITNRGNLTAGQDLTLEAGNLDLQGQLQAGGNLTLKATDTVKIRDTVTEPFVARSGGNMLIQGNQYVDILALNHPTIMPFVSSGNLTLVSDGNVSGDAHFASGASLTILNSSGGVGSFVSLNDPVIRAIGDVSFGDYTGASLKVEATGSIQGGNITINSPDIVGFPINDPDRASRSDPTRYRTLTLRAGVAADLITANVDFPFNQGTPPTQFQSPTPPLALPAGSIKVGNIYTVSTAVDPITNLPVPTITDRAGDVTLEARGQFSGDISIKSINAASSIPGDYSIIRIKSNAGSVSILGNSATGGELNVTNIDPEGIAGDIFIDAAQNVDISNSSLESKGRFGRIIIGQNSAVDKLTIDSKSSLIATNQQSRDGGVIDLKAGRISIKNSFLTTQSSGRANPGKINLTATLPSALSSEGEAIDSINLTQSIIDSSIRSFFPDGNINPAEGVTLNATDAKGSIKLESNSQITTATTGGNIPGRPIAISANTFILDNSTLSATTSSDANQSPTISKDVNGGDISITALNGSVTLRNGSFINTAVLSSSKAEKGGDITINTGSFSLEGGANGSRIQTRTYGIGEAGDIQLNFTNAATITSTSPAALSNAALPPILSGIVTSSEESEKIVNGRREKIVSGPGGSITINHLDNQIGKLTLTAGGFLSARTDSSSPGGNVQINVQDLIVQSGGQVITTSSGSGKAGAIEVNAANSVSIEGSRPAQGIFASPFLSSTLLSFPPLKTSDDLSLITQDVNQKDNIEDLGIEARYASIQQKVSSTAFVYYSFDVKEAGSRVVFDIDNDPTNTTNKGTQSSGIVPDTQISLFDQRTGQLLASNDDSPVTIGGSGEKKIEGRTGEGRTGSSSSLDSYLSFHFPERGKYVLAVGRFRSGNPGGAPLQADDTYTLQVSQQIQGKLLPPDFDPLTSRNPSQGISSGLFAQSTAPVGAAGSITINGSGTAQLTLQQGAVISASNVAGTSNGITLQGLSKLQVTDSLISTSTSGNGGTAGDITVNTSDSVALAGRFQSNSPNRAGLVAQATDGNGTAGNISVTTSQLRVADGAEINVSSRQGNAGNLFVFADSVTLNQGTLSATTGQNKGTTGANIFLLGNGAFNPNSLLTSPLNSQRIREELEASPALNFLLMRNGSQITANADPSSDATGGNIFINSELILATGSANKITADAGQGRGGNVFIVAKPLGIYNIEFRASGTVTLNDITATSLAGSSGIVSIAIPDVNPARGLNQLSIDLADASKKITPICPIAGQQGASNQFVVSGRGGLPETPASTLSSNVLVGEQATVATQPDTTQPNATSNPTASTTEIPSGIEAQGVELGANGAFILTAHASSEDPHPSWQPFQRCNQP